MAKAVRDALKHPARADLGAAPRGMQPPQVGVGERGRERVDLGPAPSPYRASSSSAVRPVTAGMRPTPSRAGPMSAGRSRPCRWQSQVRSTWARCASRLAVVFRSPMGPAYSSSAWVMSPASRPRRAEASAICASSRATAGAATGLSRSTFNGRPLPPGRKKGGRAHARPRTQPIRGGLRHPCLRFSRVRPRSPARSGGSARRRTPSATTSRRAR